jgi:hypothetical protein
MRRIDKIKNIGTAEAFTTEKATEYHGEDKPC